LAVVGSLDTTNATLCRAATGAVVALLCGQLLLVAVLRPHTTLFSFIYACLTLVLTCVSVVMQLLFIVVSLSSTSGLWLAQVSAGCNLAVVGVSAVQMTIDVVSLLLAARRRVLTISARRAAAKRHAHNGAGLGVDGAGSEQLLVVHSHDRHMMQQEELYADTSSRTSSSRRSVGRLSPADLPVFQERRSPHHSSGGGERSASLEASFRGGGSSIRLNMSMDSSSFLQLAEKRFWDRRGAAVSNGSIVLDAAVLGGRAIFHQGQLSATAPSPNSSSRRIDDHETLSSSPSHATTGSPKTTTSNNTGPVAGCTATIKGRLQDGSTAGSAGLRITAAGLAMQPSIAFSSSDDEL
jgi:uncharacterized membrane protein YgcG